jgi:hypothetical protein
MRAGGGTEVELGDVGEEGERTEVGISTDGSITEVDARFFDFFNALPSFAFFDTVETEDESFLRFFWGEGSELVSSDLRLAVFDATDSAIVSRRRLLHWE